MCVRVTNDVGAAYKSPACTVMPVQMIRFKISRREKVTWSTSSVKKNSTPFEVTINEKWFAIACEWVENGNNNCYNSAVQVGINEAGMRTQKTSPRNSSSRPFVLLVSLRSQPWGIVHWFPDSPSGQTIKYATLISAWRLPRS